MERENKRLNISLEQYNFRNSAKFTIYLTLGFVLFVWVLLTTWLSIQPNDYTLTDKVLMYLAGFVAVAFSAAMGDEDRVKTPFVILEFFEEKRETVNSVALQSNDNWKVKTDKGSYVLQLNNNDVVSCNSLNTKK